MNRFIKLFFCAIACFMIISCASIGVSKHKTQAINQSIASSVIKAIAQYQIDNKKLPVSLDSLVPNYISELPKTTTGDIFYYKKDISYEYTLCFYGRNGCCYQHTYQIWDCTGEAPED